MIEDRLDVFHSMYNAFNLTLYFDFADFLHSSSEEETQRKGFQLLETTLLKYYENTPEEEGRVQRLVVRFLQRKFVLWSPTTLEVTNPTLHKRHSYALVDNPGKKTEIKETLEKVEILSKETASVGWHPVPRGTIEEDWIDCFMSGEVDCAGYSASDPLLLFFKLRYGCVLASLQRWQKAVDKVEKPLYDAVKSPKKQRPSSDSNKDRLEKRKEQDIAEVMKMCHKKKLVNGKQK